VRCDTSPPRTLSGAISRRFDRARGQQCFDPVGEFGDALPCPLWLLASRSSSALGLTCSRRTLIAKMFANLAAHGMTLKDLAG
jgi:hypothetical protein